MSDDWLNHPNLPFFFSVRSARVTPSCGMHASTCIQTQRHSRGTWRWRGGGRGRGGEGENGLLSKCVRADKHQRTTTVFKMSISGNEKSNGSRRGCTADTEEGRRTRLWRAVSHRKRPHVMRPCANMLGSNLMRLRVSMSVEARASWVDSKKLR